MTLWRPAAAALVVLLALLAAAAPGFFEPANLRDVILANAMVLIIAVGMTLVVLTGQVDVSVGAVAGVSAVVAAVLAREGVPVPVAALAVASLGGLVGLASGAFVARLRIHSIVVTLAVLVILRDALRWATDGAWVGGLPAGFQWFGLGQPAGQALVLALAAAVVAFGTWLLGSTRLGRATVATGSDAEAARLLGLDPDRVVMIAFGLSGLLAGLAGAVNAMRFAEVPGTIPVGLELKVIAAVIVGGTAITGGRGSMTGTVVGVALLGTIGTGLTFLGVNAYWERALQGAIILAAILLETLARRAPARPSRPGHPPGTNPTEPERTRRHLSAPASAKGHA